MICARLGNLLDISMHSNWTVRYLSVGIAGILIFLCSLMFRQLHTISIQFAIHFVLGQPLLPKYRKSSLRFQLKSVKPGQFEINRHADSHLKHRLSQLNRFIGSHSIIACRSKCNSLMKSAILLAAKSTVCNLIDSAIWQAVNNQFGDGHRDPLLLRKVGNFADNVGWNLSLFPSLDWFTWDNFRGECEFYAKCQQSPAMLTCLL